MASRFAGHPRPTLTTPGHVEIDHVWDSCRDELQAVEQHIRRAIDSRAPIINQAAGYLFRSGGKRIRPLLMILAARMCGDRGPSERLLLLASTVEYIHAAALLHDDVLDEAALRRGHETARLRWGNKVSILVGDFLYTRAIDQVVRLGIPEVEAAIADACRQMVEGEMLQCTHRQNVSLTETDYVKIIECKTASLICTTCTLGAILGDASIADKAALAQFGRLLGIAFQIADDALDYAASPDKLGKSLGTDLHEGKITLPLLHLLSVCTPEEKQAAQYIIERDGAPHQGFDVIMQLMERYHSVPYALERSRQHMALAIAELRTFPPSVHRDALEVVAEYVVSRDH
jgi:octaprenyl-diphosphate synthase